ncbi:Endonuclease III [Dissulfuribacter thermophilus]|uniref:Endonuclease III n=2 Tax=Dissulfuribacter thermophilus TaxID=1156395 RepID=A0A1B9F316_9BACT|nr:Endonuclease III [Dissulfuribacter thermophilus]
MAEIGERLMDIYERLYRHFGPQGWWPGDTPFEVCVGAILTQNTSWKNVERAIENLKIEGLLSPEQLSKVGLVELAELIRPAGYYNVKAKRLRNFLDALMKDFCGSLDKLFSLELFEARRWLLSISGIGPETADSILLYAGNKPIFVVDAYTFRLLTRHEIIWGDESYDEVQDLFLKKLPNDVKLFNEYHALLVAVGKECCKKSSYKCQDCPVQGV